MKLVSAGKNFGRLDPRSGLHISFKSQPYLVPIQRHGFVWDAEDFEHLEPVGDYRTNAFRCPHRSLGDGIPLVVTSSSNGGRPFVTNLPHFVATMVLDSSSGNQGKENGTAFSPADFSIGIYDPLRINSARVPEGTKPLATDLSAALAFRLRNQRRTIINDFISPPASASGESRLYMLEPYQAGKVPVVFIHGLLSDPFSWANMVNELQAWPGFVDNFQIWVFEYPTGQSFLASAASLRQQLGRILEVYDASDRDPQLNNMVLIGHSMGGLIAKLMVTSSSDSLWRTVANRPLQQVVAEPETRNQLQASFFFEPLPSVSRVVFIGTPHRGSAYARRLIGRFGSALVREPEERREKHENLIAYNPSVFAEEFTRRIPTSIDLLEPNSPLLRGVEALPIAGRVETHSIIGYGRWTLGSGPSDGVVSTESAKHPRALTERYIDERHSELHKHEDATEEVRLLLSDHLRELADDKQTAPVQISTGNVFDLEFEPIAIPAAGK